MPRIRINVQMSEIDKQHYCTVSYFKLYIIPLSTEMRDKLRKWREDNCRNSEQIVDVGEELISEHASKLGDDSKCVKYIILYHFKEFFFTRCIVFLAALLQVKLDQKFKMTPDPFCLFWNIKTGHFNLNVEYYLIINIIVEIMSFMTNSV